ncbi:MAG: response regulator transcription factor [Anaerolineae bacterium]
MALTVLTIDDDTAITELFSILLRTYGFEVLTANSSKEGIQLVREKSPRLVLLDLIMPGMNGWEVCKAIRSFSNVPIIILSALDDPRMVASALDAGADDYLVKPVPSSVLIAHMKKLIRRTGGFTAAPEATVSLAKPGTQLLGR